ncbi:MAG: Ni/Fe hydrogenase subunit alpha [Candidatus Bathyarchaeia archaeon]
MNGRVIIEPVTRVEGHGKVVIEVKEGLVKNVFLHIVEPPRFFEKFLHGKPAEEAPRITERICGVCPVAHHLASVKAVESAWDCPKIPEPALLLRRLLLLGQFINSHALHLTILALPDYVSLGERNLFTLAKAHPEVVESALTLRKFGVEITEAVGGRGVHPLTAIPGGMSAPMSPETREGLIQQSAAALESSKKLADLFFDLMEKSWVLEFQPHETCYLATHKNGFHELYDGGLRVIGPDGKTRYEFDASTYLDYVAETSMAHSYVKYPYLKDLGYLEGLYRVGPLARLNVGELTGQVSKAMLNRYRSMFGNPAHNSFAYNLARSMELVDAVEAADRILRDEKIIDLDVRCEVEARAGVGVGVVEAPRGTLIHHYECDGRGLIEKANLIVATCQNVPSMERDVKAMVESNSDLLRSGDVRQLAWKIETLIRAYDPCISCATHLVEVKVS